MSERGMKKWAPFKSLTEQEDYLEKIHQKNKRVSKPRISSDQAEIINEILINYHGQRLTITYWRTEKINTVSTILQKIDGLNKKIILENKKTILFSEIINIQEV
ncbi:MAG: YolD-like family protein [Erysipelotrichia bacterium]|nr:YolD-like family protein [Erysipelotrichia bacterium]